MDRKQYYVSVTSKEISQIKVGNNDDFIIYATDDEVAVLRGIFDEMQSAEFTTYLRAHVPIMPYHRDKGNEQHDGAIVDAYRKIFELGDEAARQFVQETGMLDDSELDE